MMKKALGTLAVLALLVVVSLASYPATNDTNEKGSSEPASVTTKFAWSFFNVFVLIVGLYLYGLNRKASWSTVSTDQGVDELDPNLWYIHGEAYDLSQFMTRHPGGYRPLLISRGRDSTELFESYHSLTEKPRQYLKKFAVPEKNLKNYKSTFNWDMSSKVNAFQKEVREAVREHVKKNNIDTMCPPTVLYGELIWTAFTMWVTWEFYWAGVWWSSIVVPAMWWLSFIQTFHDATHFALSKSEIISNFFVYLYPYFSSPTTWDHQHVIGHHIWTNIFKKDPDLNHGMPIFRIHPRFSYRPWFRFQMFWVWLVWSVSTFWLSVVYDWTGFTTGVYHGVLPYQRLSKPRMALHLLGRAISVFLTSGIPFTLFPFWKALYWSVSFYTVWGFFFMLITQVNHVIEECIESGSTPNESWAIHQVKTSHDYSHRSFFWWLISGGLNYQIEHHLFPGINSNHLPDIAPIVQSLCKKHDIPYAYSENYFQALCKYLKVIENGSKHHAKTK